VHDRPLVHRDEGFGRWWPVAEGAVWPDSVVVPAPLFDDDLCLLERVEDFTVQELIAESCIEALAVSVFPG